MENPIKTARQLLNSQTAMIRAAHEYLTPSEMAAMLGKANPDPFWDEVCMRIVSRRRRPNEDNFKPFIQPEKIEVNRSDKSLMRLAGKAPAELEGFLVSAEAGIFWIEAYELRTSMNIREICQELGRVNLLPTNPLQTIAFHKQKLHLLQNVTVLGLRTRPWVIMTVDTRGGSLIHVDDNHEFWKKNPTTYGAGVVVLAIRP